MKILKPIVINSKDSIFFNSNSHDFTVKLNTPIEVSNPSFIALESISMFYSWFNISEAFGNNKLDYSKDSGKTYSTITIPDGNYTYKDISTYITKITPFNVDIKFSYVNLRVTINITNDVKYRLKILKNGFKELIGFEKDTIIDNSTISVGTKLPNITRSVDDIIVHTNLISSSSCSSSIYDALCQFSLCDFTMGEGFVYKSPQIFNTLNTTRISDIRIYLTDGLNRPLNLTDQNITLTLIYMSSEKKTLNS